MTAFEHCHSCKPPVRHPGCHSECPHYQVDIAKYNAARDEEQREAQEKDDYLSARHFKTRRYQRLSGRLNLRRYYEGLCGKALFLAIWAADCDKVIIENPTPSKVFEYPEPTQAIQPYQYGHPFSKKTLLWERGVQPLKPTNIVEPTATWCPSGSYSHKHGEQHKGMFTTDRAKNRAKTFPGIAKAMAEQWGGDIRECEGHHGRV